MKKKIVITLLISMLSVQCFAGCGKKDANTTSNNTVSTSTVEENTESVISVEDAKSKVVMTIDGYDVTLQDMYIYIIQYIYNNNVSATQIDDTSAKNVISECVNEIKMELVMDHLARKTEGIELTDENIKGIETTTDKFCSYFGEDFLAKYGIDKDAIRALFERQYYIDKLKNKAYTDMKTDYMNEYTEKYADLDFFSLYYVLFPSIKYDGEEAVKVSDGNYVKLTDEEMEEQLAKANELLDKAKENQKNGEEDGNLEELAKEYNIEFASGNEYGFKGGYSEELNNVIDNLENNELSDVVTTEAGYMIVRMDNNKDEDFKSYSIESMAAQTADSLFEELQKTWFTAAGIADVKADDTVLTDVDVKKLCEDMNSHGFQMTGGN